MSRYILWLCFSAELAETVKMFLPASHVHISAGPAQMFAVMAKSEQPPRGRIGRPAKPSLLSELRIARSFSQEQIGWYLGMEGDAYGKIERGSTRLKADQAASLAGLYGVDVSMLVGKLNTRRIPIRGYIGAGAEVYPADDGSPTYSVECPTGLDPLSTIAVQVRGTSMVPSIPEGWIVFYANEAHGVPTEAVNQICVVKLAGDGPTLLKFVKLGRSPARFDLWSANAPPIDDAQLEWAAPARAYLPADIAKLRMID